MKKSAIILSLLLIFPMLPAGRAAGNSGNEAEIHLSAGTGSGDPVISTGEVQWKYHPGDDPEWANPAFDDRSWGLANTWSHSGKILSGSRANTAWYRLNVVIDASFPYFSVGMTGAQAGDIRIFWDGKPVADRLDLRIPHEVTTAGAGRHMLAVRYVRPPDLPADDPGGFFINLGPAQRQIEALLQQRSEQMFFCAFTLAFGLLHLILFIFSPVAKENLYYAAFLLVYTGAIYADIHSGYLARDLDSTFFYLRLHRLLVPFTSIFGLRFIYEIFYDKCPRQFRIFTVLMLAVWVVISIYPNEHFDAYVMLSILVQLEIVRVITVAIVRKKDGAWILATGYLLLGIFGAYDALLDLGFMAPINQITNAYYFGLAGLLVAMSIYLARDFARSAQRLLRQERRIQEETLARELAEAENRRKSEEFEAARHLQLAMLPQCLNDIPGLDICFHMESATEIGGDYYDYSLADDGALTIAIGDATGHGMKAGTMVSIVKGLFITHSPISDMPGFFRKCARAIKQMRLGNLYMALMLVTIKGRELTASAAGMPPVYIRRSKTGTVETLLIKGMPLGGPLFDNYQVRKAKLFPGDAVLLMSDGFPELFNDQNEMLDYPRVEAIFREAGEKSATGIVHHLHQAGSKWANGRPQDDDITFVVVKIRADSGLSHSC